MKDIVLGFRGLPFSKHLKFLAFVNIQCTWLETFLTNVCLVKKKTKKQEKTGHLLVF
jgi:hypothetical protein